jgi:hypothetical protein
MRPKRYEFHREGGFVWALVFDAQIGLWHIEKSGPLGERVQISLAEFEGSKHGRELSGDYAKALQDAQLDA